MQSIDGEERELPTINNGEDFESSRKPSEENLPTRAEVSATDLTVTSPDTKGSEPSTNKEASHDEPPRIAGKKEAVCEYCGEKNRGHYGSCPILTGTFGFKKHEKNYVVETVRYSGDTVREYVGGYDQNEMGYIVNKIEFIDNVNRIVNLSNLLPEGVKLIRVGIAHVIDSDERFDAERKNVHYARIRDQGELFALLHEIGHAVDNSRKPSIKKRIRIFLSQFSKRMFFGQLAESERNAWSYAMAKIHEFNRQGIILEPDLDLDRHVRNCLNSYYKSYVEGEVIKGSKLDAQLKRKFKVSEGP